uniref:HNH nuclease domain-containing protein n=1 Tax=Chromera velia CCMP2878 TaxID=1169474 RepID=A0A0G4I0U4_9ALVE|eukprot:Cvel_34553.t1-p1 / transcript=Cvel_34553.t1 / gene=Cvel_34553 / organism=Chromera_velia_CCMP2878 / gene_product=Uncharacterized HNH endonuclease L247, putative / transcript_product=Uncharacterized HNH endonuclease L247, putative / location=Cvel_scaffold5976:1565-3010(+) / protein_length=372 / sequence_SO=supercontig / SO=protein_coding / is_pseudo=false
MFATLTKALELDLWRRRLPLPLSFIQHGRQRFSSCQFCQKGSDTDASDETCAVSNFLPVPSFDGVDTTGWGVSRCGHVRDSRGAVSRGYSRGRHVEGDYLSSHVRGKKKPVHRIVAETFLQEQKEQLQQRYPGERFDVDHIDGNKQNNAVSNLQWMTRKDHAKKTVFTLVRPRPLSTQGRAVLAVNAKTGEERRFPTFDSFAKFVGIFNRLLYGKVGRWTIKGWRIFREPPEKLEGEKFRRMAFLDEGAGRTVRAYVSSHGRVRHENGRVTWGSQGTMYRVVGIAKRPNLFVHRLVAEVFHAGAKAKLIADGNPSESLQVDHIDGCPTNNRADNLQWMTPSMHAKKTAEVTRRRRQPPVAGDVDSEVSNRLS